MNVELDETTTTEQTDLENLTQAADEAQAAGADTQGDESEVVVTIGDQQPPAEEERAAPAWVKELRKAHREAQRELKELREREAARAAEANPAVTVGKKPTLEEYDFDAEKFEAALTTWYERKRQADQEEQRKREETQKAEESWQATLANYGKLKAEIRVKDFAEAEMEAQNVLNQTQQGIVLQGAENPAMVIYALGKNPAKAKELAAITDPVKYAFAVAKLEAKLKVTTRKPATEPETVVTGSARVSGTVDSHLEHLREEAAKTGDYSKVVAYKNQKRNSK